MSALATEMLASTAGHRIYMVLYVLFIIVGIIVVGAAFMGAMAILGLVIFGGGAAIAEVLTENERYCPIATIFGIGVLIVGYIAAVKALMIIGGVFGGVMLLVWLLVHIYNNPTIYDD